MTQQQIKMILGVMMVGALLRPAVVQAFEVNVEAQTRVTQSDYFQHDILEIVTSDQALSKTEAFEQLTLKCKKRIDDIQFVFENRLLLWPDQTPLVHTVDNAYVSITNGPLIFYLGKQRIKWGTGYFWNPSDVLQTPKNILDLTENLEGILSVRCDYSHPWATPSLMMVFNPNDITEEAAGNYKFAGQLYKLIGTMDLFLNSVYWHNNLQSLGLALSWDVDWFIINAEAGAVKYLNKAYSLDRILDEQADELNYNYVVGLSRQLGETFFVTAEYYHHGNGLDNHSFDAYLAKLRQDASWLQYLDTTMKKDYAGFNLSYTYDNTWGINFLAVAGLNEGSCYIYPRVSYVGNPNYSIELGYFKNYATANNPEAYYAMPVDDAVELRVTGYF